MANWHVAAEKENVALYRVGYPSRRRPLALVDTFVKYSNVWWADTVAALLHLRLLPSGDIVTSYFLVNKW